jgi:hypothetical protein
MVAPVHSTRDSIHLVARPREQTHAPAAAEPCSVGGDWPDLLQRRLAPKYDGSIEEQHSSDAARDNLRSPPPSDDGCEHTIPVQGPDNAGDNILRAGSGLQAPNRESTTKGQNNSFAGPFGLSEEALVRLEAGLRAQRENLLARPAQLATAPGICPVDDDEEARAKVWLPPTPGAFRSPDTTQRLPRAAQLHPSPGLSPADDEIHVQTPDNRAPERVASSSPTTDHRRNWRLLLIISISTIIAALLGGTFPAAELTSINADLIEPAQVKAIAPQLPSTAPENSVNNQFSKDHAPSPQIGLELQATTSISPGISTQPAAPIQTSPDPVIAGQSKVPSPVVLPSGGDTSSPRSHRGRRATREQRLQARLPSPG